MKDFFLRHKAKDQGKNVANNDEQKTTQDLIRDDDKSLVLHLCGLFSEMDFNGDRLIEWEDFTSYLIEAATERNQSSDKIKEYSLKKEISSSEIEDAVKKVCYFENWDKVVTCGKTKKCKVLDPENDFATVVTLPDHNGTILNAEYIPEPYNILVTSSADLCVRFWSTEEEEEFESLHQEQLDVSQTVIKYYEKKDVLFTGSRIGEISLWKWGIAPDDYRRKDTKPLIVQSKQKKGSVMTLNGSNREMFYIQRSFKLHDDIVSDALLMHNENRMITCSLDSSIKIYDIEKEKVRNQLIGHKQGVFAVTWSNDYHFLVSAGFEHEALVWIANVETTPFKLRDQRRPHQHSLVNVHAVPNSPQVITADHKGMIKVWDIRTFQCIQTLYTESNLPKHDYKNFFLNSFTYMPKRKQMIAGGKKMHVFEYERTQNPESADDQPIFTAIYNAMSFTFLTAAGRNVKIWDALSGTVHRVFKNITESEITALCVDDRGRKFFIGTHDGDVLCFNYSNGHFVKSFEKHTEEVSSLNYTDDDTKQLISTSWDKSIRVMTDRDSTEGHISKFKVIGLHPEEIKCSTYAKSHNLVITGDIGNRIFVFDTKNGNKLYECVHKNRAEVCAMKFLSILPAFAAADTAGYIRIWTVKPYLFPYHMLIEWRNHSVQNRSGSDLRDSASFTPDASSKDRRAAPIPVTAIDFDPSTNYLYTGDVKGYITVWDLREIVDKAYLRHSSRYANVANLTEIRQSSGKFNFSKMTKKLSWKGHNEAVRSIQILKEPAAILTCSYDSQVIVWTKDGIKMDSLRQENSEVDQVTVNENTKPFNFPINLDKRRKEDAHTVSDVISKIKKQLRIINLWKSKGKESLLSKLVSVDKARFREVKTPSDDKGTPVLPTIRNIIDKEIDSPKDDKRAKSASRNSLRLPSIGRKSVAENESDSGEEDTSQSFYITQRTPSPHV